MSVHDLVIIGAGPAGIGAAYELRKSGLDIQVFEADTSIGGRTKSASLPGGAANLGAQFVYVGTATHEHVRRLALETIPFKPETYGIALGGHTSYGPENEKMTAGLPLLPGERSELTSFLNDAVAEYSAMTDSGKFTERSEALASMTMADRLSGHSPRIKKIVTTAIRAGAVGEPEELIAQYALRYFGSYVAHDHQNRELLVNGMQSIVESMAQDLPADTVHTSAPVAEITRETENGPYSVCFPPRVADQPARTVHTRQVLIAVPSALVSGLVPWLPKWKSDALRSVRTPGNTTMVVAVDASETPELKDWGMVTTVDSQFDCVLNNTPGRWRDAEDTGLLHFTCYGNRVGYAPELMTDKSAQEEWLNDFLEVMPQARGRIRGYRVQSWPHCFSLLSLQRNAVLEQLRRPVGRIHFAGDWNSATAGTHGAFAEARRVANEILSFASDALV